MVRRILSRLELAEVRESNPHFRDDYRISWITVLRAARGEPRAHVSASYAVLGLHPEKVWPALTAQRRAKLGPLYGEFFGVNLPRKPAQSVRDLRRDRAA